jgi:hypothetical protein
MISEIGVELSVKCQYFGLLVGSVLFTFFRVLFVLSFYGFFTFLVPWCDVRYDFRFVFTSRDRRGRDRMVVAFTVTYATSAYHHYRCEFESRSGEMYLI